MVMKIHQIWQNESWGQNIWKLNTSSTKSNWIWDCLQNWESFSADSEFVYKTERIRSADFELVFKTERAFSADFKMMNDERTLESWWRLYQRNGNENTFYFTKGCILVQTFAYSAFWQRTVVVHGSLKT